MDYTQIQLPSKTVELLAFVAEHDGKVNPILLANSCSDDENWPRIKQLLELDLVRREQAYKESGELGDGSVLWVTNEGRAFLTDRKNERLAKRRDYMINIFISAVTAALVAWGPNILSWLQSLTSKS